MAQQKGSKQSWWPRDIIIDFDDSFSPVAKFVIIKIFFSIATTNSWPLHQLDINNAFLDGYLDEEVYMFHQKGIIRLNPDKCVIRKGLFIDLSKPLDTGILSLLVSCKFMGLSNHHDNCLFILSNFDFFQALLVYVDDVLLTGNSEAKISKVKRILDQTFTIKDLDAAMYFFWVQRL